MNNETRSKLIRSPWGRRDAIRSARFARREADKAARHEALERKEAGPERPARPAKGRKPRASALSRLIAEKPAYDHQATLRAVRGANRKPVARESRGVRIAKDGITKLFRDYEPEQAYGTAADFREHQRYGGTREDY